VGLLLPERALPLPPLLHQQCCQLQQQTAEVPQTLPEGWTTCPAAAAVLAAPPAAAVLLCLPSHVVQRLHQHDWPYAHLPGWGWLQGHRRHLRVRLGWAG
jgi:hypothetical protein